MDAWLGGRVDDGWMDGWRRIGQHFHSHHVYAQEDEEPPDDPTFQKHLFGACVRVYMGMDKYALNSNHLCMFMPAVIVGLHDTTCNACAIPHSQHGITRHTWTRKQTYQVLSEGGRAPLGLAQQDEEAEENGVEADEGLGLLCIACGEVWFIEVAVVNWWASWQGK